MGIDAVLDKVKWTRHHFDILNKAVMEYVDPENTQFFVERYDETKTMAWGHFDSKIGPPTHISHIFGDVLQSANSCLDYLVCELFGRYNNGEAGNPPPPQLLLRPLAVAKRLGVSERWVRDHATRRFPKLPVIKLGPLLRFRQADVDEFVERLRDDHSGTKRLQ